MAQNLVLSTLPNNIDNAGVLRQFVVNLFYGWGYNAYRQENKDRADDLLVRQEVTHWLGQARAEISYRESDFRRKYLPPPTRDNPFPDQAVVAQAQAYLRLSQAIETLEVDVRNAAVPEDDRTWRRHRNEGGTLKQLIEADLDIAESTILVLRDVCAETFDPGKPLTSLQRLNSIVVQRKKVLSVFCP